VTLLGKKATAETALASSTDAPSATAGLPSSANPATSFHHDFGLTANSVFQLIRSS